MAQSKKTDDANDDSVLKVNHKKAKNIQPIHEDALKKQLQEDKKLAQANADVLAELAAKTAELAEKVKGPESPKERVLTLDEPESAQPKDIFAALDEPQPKSHHKELGNEGVVNAGKKSEQKEANSAADLIRKKLNRLYKDEPDAATEAAEAIVAGKHRSKHQEFMYQLTVSGKSLAEIQTEWHNYYVALPDDDKHDVWQEFYKDQSTASAYNKNTAIIPKSEQKSQKSTPKKASAPKSQARRPRTNDDVKTQIMDRVSANGKLKPIDHFKSLLFGVGMAAVIGLAATFVFFNEVFVAPFISPSRTVSATPIIGDANAPVGPEPKIIVPKINLEVPVVYDLGSVAENDVQDALEDGVVHYATSPEPGEQGNSVIVGHSSNNILNSGRYKFAFVLLKRLEIDDTFLIHKDGVRYTYKIFEKKIVPPTDVSVLGPSSRANTMTLITCDPPGTSINRLIIVAEQISPDPAGNKEAVIDVDPIEQVALPSNAPSLWSRLNPFD